MSGKIRFGALACSTVAKRRFLPALLRSETAALTFLASRDIEKAKAFQSEFGAAKIGSYEDLLADPDVDCVYISTPVTSHETWIIKALAAGKHVLCEKPAVLSYESAQRVVEAAKRYDRLFFEGYMFRFHPQHDALAAVLASGDLGPLRSFRAQFTYPRPPEGNIRLDPTLNGGAFDDSLGYTVMAMRRFLGDEIDSLSLRQVMDDSGVDAQSMVTARYANGVTAELLAGFGDYVSEIMVAGDLKSATLNRAFSIDHDRVPELVFDDLKNGSTIKKLPKADQFLLMIDFFCDSIIRKTYKNSDFYTNFTGQYSIINRIRQAI